MTTMTKVAILLPPAGLPGQVSMYRAIFGVDRRHAGGPAFALAFARQRSRAGLAVLAQADIIAVAPGARNVGAGVAAALREAVRRGCRILAVGGAVHTVAAAGLLDGRPVAAGPADAEELRSCYPRVRVAMGVRFVDDDPIFSAAAGTAGIDLCLHVVRKYHGADAATAISLSLNRLITVDVPPSSKLPREFRYVDSLGYLV